MARDDDFAPKLVPPDGPDIGIRQGILREWNPGTGANVVDMGGALLSDLPIQAAGSLVMSVGDVLALLRYGYTYFIVGVIRTPPQGSMATQADRVTFASGTADAITSGSFVSPATFGPQITEVYVGPSRKCLVTLSVQMGCISSTGIASYSVNGASTINAEDTRGCLLAAGTEAVVASVSKTSLLTAADGLNEGLHTFTTRVRKVGSGPVCNIGDRDLIVQPY